MEPYYFQIKDIRKFLSHYLEIYRSDYSKTRARKIINLFPISMKSKKVLDIGCGGGFYSLAACRKGARDITLLDVSSVCESG